METLRITITGAPGEGKSSLAYVIWSYLFSLGLDVSLTDDGGGVAKRNTFISLASLQSLQDHGLAIAIVTKQKGK